MLFKPQYAQGIDKENSSLKAEGGYIDGNFVRFKEQSVEPIGGWQIQTVQQYDGKARGCHAWRTLEGDRVQAFGTATKLFAVVAGAIKDITPPLHETVLNDVFTTVSGSPIVAVELPFHRLNPGDTVVFANHQSTVGGLTIEGTYTVTEVITSGKFTITHASNASSTVSTAGGGLVDFYAALPAGYADEPVTGYGTGSYGAGGYSVGIEYPIGMRTWSLDNWGEFLLANPTGYGLFEWQPEKKFEELTFNGTFTGNADGWALGTGWTYSSNTVVAAAGTASNLSQDFRDILEGGKTYRIIFTVTRSAGTVKFQVNAGSTPAVIDVGTASSVISKSGTYSRTFTCPADPKDIVFAKDNAFIGSIDNVSLKLEEKAYRITSAPPRIDASFVDPRGLVITIGTTDENGQYNPTNVRNSGLGNNRVWVPDTNNVASVYPLRGGGGRLLCGLSTAEQNLIWGDDGVFSLQYQGAAGAAYKPVLLGTGCGAISRMAVAEQNGFVAWMANTRQFFIFRGVSSYSLGKPEIIKCPIQKDVFDNLNESQQFKCHAGINPEFSEVWFFYPDTRDGDGDECSRVAVVDWTAAVWSQHDLARTAWQSSGIYGKPVGYGTDGYIYKHEVENTANGALIPAEITSAAFDSGDGDTLTIFDSIIPDWKDQNGNVEYTIFYRLWPNDAWRTAGPFTSTTSTRELNFLVKAREFQVKVAWVTPGGWARTGSDRYSIRQTRAKR